MPEGHYNIKVFSDTTDLVSVSSALKQLELKGFPLNVTFPNELEIGNNDIVVLRIESLNSNFYKSILKIKRGKTNKFIIIINNSDALLVTSLLKQGFLDIFVFPYEVLKFTSFLSEIISNKSYITETNRVGTFGMNRQGINSILGNSEKLLRAVELASKVSEKSSSNVLILGETGTGKGLFARAIHNNGPLNQFPFIDIVCTAIPENLLESELFGYEAGAFTDARTRKIGLFELAERGTLFLDEIGDLSFNIQTKLLRAVEKKVIKRLGGVVDIPVNARIISATNRDLEFMVEQNLFRRDLFHRLNVVSLEIPPLRERGEDIVLIANHFIDEFNKQFNKSVKKLDKDIQHLLMGHPWPGNVRELRNAMERAVLLSDDRKLQIKDFTNLINNRWTSSHVESKLDEIPTNIVRLDVNYGITSLRNLDKEYARKVLTKMGGNKTQTAKLLGISRPKLDTLLKN
ncbi:MAG: sigma-54 dependent transcriptional regulator [Ignavibacteriaceae bacterium]|jgi:DNA-binding NtrC family response regulator|nr:sigma-54 dependent transcriptional regulator [Ignavibacteriaceae bacterium]MCW8823173.1 sigma-54 dependent transcriptional regulator [Ignavibacteriaceae bacterium]MCW8994783.1 sigma-54 dependent transcriptional regulator [Psychromonas sp.]